MNTQQQHGEPERREGLGGRVRRFVDSELSRVRDKENRSGESSDPDNPRKSDDSSGLDRTTESDRPYEAERAYEADRAADKADPPPHQEPVAPSPAASGRADPAMTTAPVDSAYIPAIDDDRGKEPEPEPFRGRSREQTAADAGAERIGLLNDPASLRAQWQQVQGTFVDDPQRAVREASELVERTLQEIHANVARGQTGDPTSTEDLRLSFQRYREFFQRLLSA